MFRVRLAVPSHRSSESPDCGVGRILALSERHFPLCSLFDAGPYYLRMTGPKSAAGLRYESDLISFAYAPRPIARLLDPIHSMFRCGPLPILSHCGNARSSPSAPAPAPLPHFTNVCMAVPARTTKSSKFFLTWTVIPSEPMVSHAREFGP